MTVFPHAKINIGLHVVSKRADGFHNIETVLYPVKIYDALEMIPDPQRKEVTFSMSGYAHNLGVEENLCIKAFRLLEKRFNIPAVKMHLHKNIPSGAGLGGGSSDAAYTLRLANELFDLGLNTGDLQDLARRLGSDCAFFLEEQPVYAFEKGDRFRPLSLSLKDYHLVVVMPDLGVSTAAAYGRIVPRMPDCLLETHTASRPDTWKAVIRNDFESAIFPDYPVLATIKEALYKAGAVYASLSGSGAALYGVFKNRVVLPDLERECRVFYDVG